MSVRENDPKERYTTKEASHKIYEDVVDESIRTCNLDELSKLTKKVRDFQVLAEGQPQRHQTVEQGIPNANEHGERNQQATETGVHDNGVPQWVTNGHIVVIGHGCKDKIFQTNKHHDEADLGDTAYVAYALAVCLDVHQHLWDRGCA